MFHDSISMDGKALCLVSNTAIVSHIPPFSPHLTMTSSQASYTTTRVVWRESVAVSAADDPIRCSKRCEVPLEKQRPAESNPLLRKCQKQMPEMAVFMRNWCKPFQIPGMCQISIGLLSGWWFFATPLKNDGVRQLGSLFPTEWQKKSHVPNHQPDCSTTFYILRQPHVWPPTAESVKAIMNQKKHAAIRSVSSETSLGMFE